MTHNELGRHIRRKTCEKSLQENSFHFGVDEDSLRLEDNKDNPFREPDYSKHRMKRYLVYYAAIHDVPDSNNVALDIEVSTSEESNSHN